MPVPARGVGMRVRRGSGARSGRSRWLELCDGRRYSGDSALLSQRYALGGEMI